MSLRKYGKAGITSTLFAALLFVGAVSHPVSAEQPRLEAEVAVQNEYTSLETNWGYGPAETAYNALNLKAIEEIWKDHDNPLDPILFKALIAVESSFKTGAYSRTGCAGLVQLAPDTAKRFGLSLAPVDERLIPEKAIPAGVKVLAEKHRVVLEPENYYGILLGKPDQKLSYGMTVSRHYQEVGTPKGYDLLHLGLAAYNGGGGTIMRAMAKAVEMGKNPLDWNALVGTGPADSPLYAACEMIYKAGAPGKWKEIANYPKKILDLTSKVK